MKSSTCSRSNSSRNVEVTHSPIANSLLQAQQKSSFKPFRPADFFLLILACLSKKYAKVLDMRLMETCIRSYALPLELTPLTLTKSNKLPRNHQVPPSSLPHVEELQGILPILPHRGAANQKSIQISGVFSKCSQDRSRDRDIPRADALQPHLPLDYRVAR